MDIDALGWAIIMMVGIGVFVGGIAGLAARGKGLLLYIAAAIVGQIVFPTLLDMGSVRISGGLPVQIVLGLVGATVFVFLAWLLTRLRRS